MAGLGGTGLLDPLGKTAGDEIALNAQPRATTSASAGDGESKQRKFHNACAPYSAKACL
jgi:hypothetical protein